MKIRPGMKKDDNFARLCVQSQKRYRSRCDFALDIDGLSVDEASQPSN